MQTQGWTVTKSDLGDMRAMNCTKENRTVSITANPTKGKTDILIGIAKE
jgi:hypothetical protein